jgi:hypothetical protein
VGVNHAMKKTVNPAVGELNVYEFCEMRPCEARTRPCPSVDSFLAPAARLPRDLPHYIGSDNHFLSRRNIWDHICDCSLMHPWRINCRNEMEDLGESRPSAR